MHMFPKHYVQCLLFGVTTYLFFSRLLQKTKPLRCKHEPSSTQRNSTYTSWKVLQKKPSFWDCSLIIQYVPKPGHNMASIYHKWLKLHFQEFPSEHMLSRQNPWRDWNCLKSTPDLLQTCFILDKCKYTVDKLAAISAAWLQPLRVWQQYNTKRGTLEIPFCSFDSASLLGSWHSLTFYRRPSL